MDIMLASGNAHKKREVQEILDSVRVTIPSDLGLTFEYEETGDTFLANALGKAMHLHEISGRAALADDSGLAVPALGGEPGVHSARYGDDTDHPPASDEDRYRLLLERMEGVSDRSAMFVCCMVLVTHTYRFSVVQETWEGTITHEAVGSRGFGYDPVFFVPEEGKTAAQLAPDHKNRLSHRGKALSRLKILVADLG